MTDTAPKPDSREARSTPRASLPRSYTQQEWDDVSDTPELTETEAAGLRPAREVPEVYGLLPKRGRGRPKRADAKVNLTLRVEPALLEAYKATGPGWQVRMQDALAAFLATGNERPSGGEGAASAPSACAAGHGTAAANRDDDGVPDANRSSTRCNDHAAAQRSGRPKSA